MTTNSWSVIVPMKDTTTAKSRMGGTATERRQLAIAMARDTLCAVANAELVERVLVVCDRAEDIESFSLPGVEVLVVEGGSLNAAVLAGAARIRAGDPGAALASLPGDLPYLRSTELDVALAKASRFSRCCVADPAGVGTTLLTARPSTDLLPCYGEDSLLAHRAGGAIELNLPVWWGLRRDVDLPEDLKHGVSLGFRTRGLLERRRIEGMIGVSS
jgi:2-phospho-L-lactate guanylyltransferase